MKVNIRALSPEGRRQYLEYLHNLVIRAEHFEALSHMGEGKYLVYNMDARIGMFQRSYRMLDLTVGNEQVTLALAKLQAKEEEATFWRDLIKEWREVKEQAIADIADIRETIEASKKASSTARTQPFVPTDHKPDKEKQQ